MQSFVVKSAQGDYAVEFPTAITPLAERLAQLPRTVAVVDRIVADLYPEQLAPIRDRLPTLLIDACEDEKTLNGAAKVCGWLQEQNATKQTVLLAIGGGITQDICAFTAHVYYRGLRWVYLPTTLLAMSDSCIGAKCCINHKGYKNQLGAFHSPWQVHVYTPFIDTLADAAVASGYGEILKLMVIGSEGHLACLERAVDAGGCAIANCSR